jgi:hypothetical protein
VSCNVQNQKAQDIHRLWEKVLVLRGKVVYNEDRILVEQSFGADSLGIKRRPREYAQLREKKLVACGATT